MSVIEQCTCPPECDCWQGVECDGPCPLGPVFDATTPEEGTP